MGAFVTGSTFQHDVFVSYAHADNPAYDQSKGWVERLVGHLRELLPEKLQRGKPDIKFDFSLPRNTSFPEHIREAVTHSATLLVIFSENYLASEWCQTELSLFLDAASQTEGAEGRIFLVRRDDLQPSQRPEALRELLGYPFFVRDEDHQRTQVLGSPFVDDPDQKRYFQELDDLRCELADRLLQMKRMAETQETQEVEPPGDQPTIFLAEVTPDLEDARENIRRHLKQMQFRVLPETLYDRSPDAYEIATQADLAQSLVFVQLLGQFATAKTADVPKGYEGLQMDLAENRGLPVLRWHSPELDPDSMKDQALLKRADVMVMAFEDFKRKIVEEAQRQATMQKWSEQRNEDAFILVKANSPEQHGSRAIQDFLDRNNCAYDTADKDENVELLVDEYGFNGLIIVYDRVEGLWAKQELRTCRKLMLKKRGHAPLVCAVYTVPPHEEPSLGIRLPNVRHLSQQDHDALAVFLAEVQAKVAAS